MQGETPNLGVSFFSLEGLGSILCSTRKALAHGPKMWAIVAVEIREP
jgi:hypothetical protein